MYKHDWHDMLPYRGSYKYPYRIAWCWYCGIVRAQPEGKTYWRYSKKPVKKAEYAITIGYELLKGGTT